MENETSALPGVEPREGESRSELVYRSLRTTLMEGGILPTERLAEEALAERFGVSRTPVREALTRLQADGLVERRDGGLYLHIPSFDSIADLYELRINLELYGIERAIRDRSLVHDEAVLRRELDTWYAYRDSPPPPDAGFVAKDEGFHGSLLRSSGNLALVEALASVNQKIRPIRMYDYLTEDRIDATVSEHIHIAELVLGSQLSEALSSLRDHVEESRAVVMDRASKAFPVGMLTPPAVLNGLSGVG
jgi:DNA-binding GntR family transcriptional regulator